MELVGLIRVVGVVLAVWGMGLLHAAWKHKSGNGGRLLGGWGLINLSIVAWGWTSGPDKGPALGILAAILIALLYILHSFYRAEIRPKRTKEKLRAQPSEKENGSLMGRIWVGVLVGPCAGLAALAVCTAGFGLFRRAGVEPTLNLTLVSFAFPILWGGLAVLAGYSENALKKSLVIILSGLLPLVYILTSSQ